MMAGLTGVLLAYGHWKPALAEPLPGMWLAVGVGLATLLAGLIARRAGVRLEGFALPAAALTLFVAWAWARTALSSVPAEGAAEIGSFILGIVAFWLGALTVAAGRKLLAPSDPPSAAAEKGAENGAVASRPLGAQDGAASSPGGGANPTERLFLIFFSLLALVFSVHAIVEYHFLYQFRYAEMGREGLIDETNPISQGVAYALQHRRVSSRFGNPNVFCGFLAMCLPLVLALGACARGRHRWWERAALGAAAAAMLYAAWRTQSAGGGAVLVAVGALTLVALLLQARKSIPARGAGAALAITVAIALAIPGSSRTGAQPARAESQGRDAPVTAPRTVRAAPAPSPATSVAVVSAAPEPTKLRQARTVRQRLLYLQSGLRMWLRAPLFGHGLGAYERLYAKERILGAGETAYAHNFLVQLAVETGLVGVALFLWFLGLLARRFRQGFRTRLAGAARLGLGCAALAFVLDSLGDYTFYVREVLFDFCLLAGALCVVAMPQRKEAPPGAAPSQSRAERRRMLRAAAGKAAPARNRRAYVVLLSAGIAGAGLYLAGLAVVIVPGQMALDCEWLVKDVGREIAAAQRDARDRPEKSEELAQKNADLLGEAFGLADRALGWTPSNPRLWQTRAHLFAQAGMLDSAVADMRRAISLHPDSASMRAEMGAYEWMIADGEAREPAGQGGQGAQDEAGKDRKGTEAEISARRREALRLTDAAISLYPLNYRHRLQRARFLAAMGRRAEAAAAAREAIRVSFDNRELAESRRVLAEVAK
jgi:tetratricopeptide (TPR) repeat protein